MNFSKVVFLFLWMLVTTVTMAQAQEKETPAERKARIEKIETAKIAYITDKLSLTSEQASRFWPLYKEHDGLKNQLRQKSRAFKDENLSKLTDEQIQNGLEARLGIRQQELNLDKEYMDKYLKVISSRQLALLYRSEREFTKLLLERLQTAKR